MSKRNGGVKMQLHGMGSRDEFPAVLTWKGGLEKVLVDIMRPLFDKGFRANSFANTNPRAAHKAVHP